MGAVRTVAGSGYGNALVDSLIWGGYAWNPSQGPIRYSFGGSDSDWYDANGEAHDGFLFVNPAFVYSWTASEKAAFRYALKLYSSVCGITFEEAATPATADIVWWQANLDHALGVHEPPSPGQRWGIFDPLVTTSWGHFSIGGDGLDTIIHELGHSLGLAHPHDGGFEQDATRFPGVRSSSDLGTDGMNQGIWTVMSYNTGYDRAPSDSDYGAQGGLGALDIAALQALYGSNMTTRTGDNTYRLPTANQRGTGWSCIWDAGGTDTVSAAGARISVQIDLRPAPLTGHSAGGYVSWGKGIGGGFTIAHGVTIENAVGGSLADTLTGNDWANVLNGNGGADRMDGRAGDDTYIVDNAADRVVDTGGGQDTVRALVSYALDPSSGIEILQAFSLSGRTPLKLTGSNASNTITGNAGSNILDGMGGNDALSGGRGRDIFLFDTKLNAARNVDHITDFSSRDDTIRLDKNIFKGLGSGTLNSTAFHIVQDGSFVLDRSDRVVYDATSGFLYFDPDGAGRHGATKFAQLDPGLALKASDFYVV